MNWPTSDEPEKCEYTNNSEDESSALTCIISVTSQLLRVWSIPDEVDVYRTVAALETRQHNANQKSLKDILWPT